MAAILLAYCKSGKFGVIWDKIKHAYIEKNSYYHSKLTK